MRLSCLHCVPSAQLAQPGGHHWLSDEETNECAFLFLSLVVCGAVGVGAHPAVLGVYSWQDVGELAGPGIQPVCYLVLAL